MKVKTAINFIILLCLFALHAGIAKAEQETTLRFSPILIVDSSQTMQDKKGLLLQGYSSATKDSSKQAQITNQNHQALDDIENHSLALGATLHINDNLNIGAACGVQLLNEEPITLKDLSIATMVTMQF